jgi:hypothetical protein
LLGSFIFSEQPASFRCDQYYHDGDYYMQQRPRPRARDGWSACRPIFGAALLASQGLGLLLSLLIVAMIGSSTEPVSRLNILVPARFDYLEVTARTPEACDAAQVVAKVIRTYRLSHGIIVICEPEHIGPF